MSEYGLQVVYQGGIYIDLDEALYEAIGHDSNDEGCGLRTGRRDMFWRCIDFEAALGLRGILATDIAQHPEFQKKSGERQLVFAIKTEEQHWDEKLAALTESTDPPQTRGTKP